MVRNSQNEISIQLVSYVNDLNRVKKAVLRDSARWKATFGIIYDQTLTADEQKNILLKWKSRGITKQEKTWHISQ